MAYRELEVTLLSARDLKSVNLFTRMDVYAVASISGDPMTRQCTPTDTTGGRYPSWNATLRFSVPPSAASATASGGGWLHVLLRSQRALGDRDVGEVVVPLAELLDGADGTGPQPPRQASYQVHTVPRGESRGVLNVSYRLGPVVAPVAESNDGKAAIVGYPAPQQPFKPQNPQHNGYAPQTYQYHPQYNNGYAPAQQAFKPQNPQQPYQYYDAYAPAQQQMKPQTPAAPQQPYQYNPQHEGYAPPAQQPTKPQTPAPKQQTLKPQTPASPQKTYSYNPQHEGHAPPKQQPTKPQNPAPKQQPYQYHDDYAPVRQQSSTKPQTPASPQQPYQYHDDYALVRQQSSKPQTQASPQPKQPYQYHDDYALVRQQSSSKPQTQASPQPKPYHPPRESYAPPPWHDEAPALSPAIGTRNGGYGPTNYYMGPHTQIILGAPPPPPPPARSNSFSAKTKTDDGPAKPKPSYTPVQPSKSPSKSDYSWPKSVQHQDNSPAWPKSSPKNPEDPTTRAQQHDTKTSASTLQHITSLGKTTDHASWPKASPQHPQSTPPAWPKPSPNKNPDSSTTATQPQQHDTKVVEHNVQKTPTKIGSGKPDHSKQAMEEQKSTQVSVTKTNGTPVRAGDYARSQSSNFQAGKVADSTKTKEAYANTRSNSTPAKAADQHQAAGHKPGLQHERVHSFPTTAAR